MNILGIESIIYGADDVAAATRFYDDWGLAPMETGAAGAVFALPDKTTIVIRPIDDPALPPPPVPGPTVREIVWGVGDRATLDAVGAELSKDRDVEAGPDGTLHSIDDLGYHIGFRVTARAPQPSTLPPTNTVGTAQRRDERAESAFTRRCRPRRIGHAVYWAPRGLDGSAAFYTDRLGFRITEGIRGGGVFLRCGASHDHHNFLLQHRGANYGFQHVAFEVADLDEVMMCGSYMEARGWRSHLGPGRHVMGSSTYWYFWNPAGGVAEFFSDMDYVTDAWVAEIHDKPLGGGSSWRARKEDEGLAPGHGEWPTLEE